MYTHILLTVAFVAYGTLQIFLREDFEEGKRWGEIALSIMDANSTFVTGK